MNIVSVYSNKSQIPNSLHIGDVMGLWDVSRNKIVGLSIMSIYFRQAQDKDLKSMIKAGVYLNIKKHVNAIQGILQDKGFIFPLEPNWESKFTTDSRFMIPQSMLDDEEITISLREILRLTLTLETEGIRNASNAKVKMILSGIVEDDYRGFDALLQLQKDKKWTEFPPLAMPQ